ncbi:MAG TPA: NAD(P)-dependent oxidoreductase [Anaerolineales bacterium]|jgi:phosphoglycerate dehydrogenase-like enzyme
MGVFTVVFADGMTEADLAWAQSLAPADGLVLAAPPEERPGDFGPLLAGANALVVRHQAVTAEVFEAAPNLQLIQRYSTRCDGVDLLEARQRGVQVATMPLHGAVAVAELAIALVLGLSKDLIHAHRHTAAADYRTLGVKPILTDEHTYQFNWMKLSGLREVYGQTLGVIGFGEIGTEAARRARAFGMRIVYNKRRRLPPEVEQAEEATYGSKEEVVRAADYLLLSTPLTPQTTGMIGRRELDLMKPTAFLVNVAKGAVVDEAALVEVLQSGRIAGAGLDVFVREPLPHGDPLLTCDNVILTPHIGGGTAGAKAKQMHAVLENVQRFVQGKPVLHRVV